MPYVVQKQSRNECPCGSRAIDMLFPLGGPDHGPGYLICHTCRRISCISRNKEESGEIRRIDDD